MPEITDAEFRQFVRYQSLGTPEELERLPRKVSELEADNKKQRDEIRDLKEKVPAENMVAIPKEKADLLKAYEKLGRPEELATVASERDELRQKVAQRERRDAITAAVGAMGWAADTVATIEDMASLQGATFEVEVTKNDKGEEVRTAYITLAGEGQQKQKLADFAASAPQLKGLKTDAAESQEKAPTLFPPQEKGGSKAKPDNPVAAHIRRMQEQAAARTNPLLPQTKTT